MDNYSAHISGSMIFRSACVGDIPAISLILRMAVERMLAEGKCQWSESYPNETNVRADMASGTAFVLENDGEVIGYAAVVLTGEPAYASIDGGWISEGGYVVAHRLAVSQSVRGRGVGKIFMAAIAEYAGSLGFKSFRIDTNFDNFAMLGLLDKLGFTYCGEIKYESGTRMAFEKLLR